MIPEKVFWFVGFYIFLLIFLMALGSYGLTSLVTANIPNVTQPSLNPPPVPEDCEGFWCFLSDWGTAITNGFNYIYYFFSNIAFLFNLIVVNPFSTIAVFGYFFTFMTIIFILCVLLIIRG